MKNMTVANLIKVTGGTYHGSEKLLNQEIQGVASDSRKVHEGYLYVPFQGVRVDGHQFIPQVMEDGCLLTLSERKLYDDVPYLEVKSSGEALKAIATFYREQLSCKIIGVTGSVGKTSTKEMIASVLGEKYNVQKTIGNFNNEIGLPLTICSIRERHDVAVVEMGISEFGEMSRLGAIAKPDVCVITNIGDCHLDNLKNRDGVLKAKTELFKYLQNGAPIILNGDDERLRKIEEVDGEQPIFYSIHDTSSDYYCESYESLGVEGSNAVLRNQIGRSESYKVHIPLPGKHHLWNALAAACVGQVLDLTNEQVAQGISLDQAIDGRSKIYRVYDGIVVDDCYNANPMSMKASLGVLGQSKGRKIAVLGDMGELGENEKQMHYEVGNYAGKCQLDQIFLLGKLSKEIQRGAQEVGSSAQIVYVDTIEELEKRLIENRKPGDVTWIKASHFMGFERLVLAMTR